MQFVSFFFRYAGSIACCNYTGVYVKPAPPVFDPVKVADAMVKLARHPKPATNSDVATPLFKMAYSFMPGFTRRIMQKVMSSYLKSAPGLPATDGNVFRPVTYGNAITAAGIRQQIKKVEKACY